MVTKVPLEKFKETFESYPDLCSEVLGGKVVGCSDEFFAAAANLIKTHPPVSMKGQFGPNGALYDGWETRRHNPTCDWVIIRLGPPGGGRVIGFDIDTANFNGNEAPATRVEGTISEGDPAPDDFFWEEILPLTPLGPSSQHLFKLERHTRSYTHLKLYQIPDGGIARFRAYGIITMPDELSGGPLWDLVYALNGGRVVYSSNQHFGVASNLILPGRGKDMGDGWETKRSRKPGNSDCAIIKLFHEAFLAYVEVDTANFIGNYPQSCGLEGVYCQAITPPEKSKWIPILKNAKLGPHRQQFFQLDHVDQMFTHVKLTIYPDGGIKRLRVLGTPLEIDKAFAKAAMEEAQNSLLGTNKSMSKKEGKSQTKSKLNAAKSNTLPKDSVHAIPLSLESFSPYGSVIESFGSNSKIPAQIKHKMVNDGRAVKIQDLAPVQWHGPKHIVPNLNFHVFSCEPWRNDKVDIAVMERHLNTTQTFIPMGAGGSNYLVIVAKSNSDGTLDWKTLKAFIATNKQGISYHPGIWHHPMITLGKHINFASLMYETGDDEQDCEVVRWENEIPVRVLIP